MINLDGSIKKYKIQYIIEGFEQCFNCNYTETQTNMIKSNFYKVLIIKTAAKDFKLELIDVILAYLYGCLDKDETIYDKLLLKYFTNSENCIALLNSALYDPKKELKYDI